MGIASTRDTYASATTVYATSAIAGDGCFILPLLQSWIGMFSSEMELRWSIGLPAVMMPVGTDTVWTGQRRARDLVRRPAG